METIRAVAPSDSNSTPARCWRVSSSDTEKIVLLIMSRSTAGLDREGLRLGDGGQLGIVAVGHTDHLELDLAAPDLRPVLLRPAHAHLVVRKPLDDLVQLARRHRQAALFLDLGVERDLRADVQIGRAAEELVLALRAQEDVGEDGERALSIGDPVRQVEPPQELFLPNLELHPSLLGFPGLFYL